MYKVQVRIADHEIITDDPKFFKGSYNRFYFRTEKPSIMTAPYVDVLDIGKVYVYLLRESKDGLIRKSHKPICFYRGNVSDFMNDNPEIKWY